MGSIKSKPNTLQTMRFIEAAYTPVPSSHGYIVPQCAHTLDHDTILNFLKSLGLVENVDFKVKRSAVLYRDVDRVNFLHEEAFAMARLGQLACK